MPDEVAIIGVDDDQIYCMFSSLNCFIAIDGKRLYLVGASLKDLGWKCFAFTELLWGVE